MTDELDPVLAALLADDDLWDEPPAELEQAVLAAIASEAPPDSEPVEQPVDQLAERRRRRQLSVPWWLGAAAACALVVAGVLLVVGRGDGETERAAGSVVDLSPTELFPEASGTADVAATAAGLRIVLDTDGLPAAGPDHFYEAWITDGTVRVSAGSFHLNGASAPIELWAGVDRPTFRTLTVTLEPIDGVAESSGQVVLRGTFAELDD